MAVTAEAPRTTGSMKVWSAWKCVTRMRRKVWRSNPARRDSAGTGAPQSTSTDESMPYAALQPHPLKASPLPNTVRRIQGCIAACSNGDGDGVGSWVGSPSCTNPQSSRARDCE